MSMMFEDRGAYAIAEAKAVESMRSLDPSLAASERGVQYDEDSGSFLIPLLGTPVRVAFPTGEVTAEESRRLSGALAVIALHYLVYRGEPLRAEGWLAYRDMPGGRDFSRAFESMAEAKLAGALGSSPVLFARAAAALGGEPGGTGEHSFIMPALPRVPLLVVLWPACEDVGSGARLLFKPSAPYYLHTEDLAALGIVTVERLIHQARRR